MLCICCGFVLIKVRLSALFEVGNGCMSGTGLFLSHLSCQLHLCTCLIEANNVSVHVHGPTKEFPKDSVRNDLLTTCWAIT